MDVIFDYHAVLSDRPGDLLTVEADHRRHAVVEHVIADLKHHAGLAHLPSARFAANAAWLALVGVAYNPFLEWAAGENRVLLTHDVATITRYAYDRVRHGLPMPGVFEVPLKLDIGHVIEDILLLTAYSLEGEWEGQVRYLPLR